MKVAIVTNQIESTGGVEIFTKNIAKLLEQREHQVDIISKESLSFVPKRSLEKAIGGHFYKMHKMKKYDVVLCNGEFGYSVEHPKAINVFHGNYYGYALAVKDLVNNNLTKERLEKAEMQRVSARDKYVVTISDYSRIQLEEFGIPVNKVIPLSIDSTIFYPKKRKTTDIALAISRGMHFEKGFDVLKRLAEKGIRIRLFSDEKIDLPSVENMNLVDNTSLREEYNKAQIFLNPTRFEGGGLTTLEAMACGCPVITTPTGYGYDIREVIPNFVADTFAGFFAKYVLVSNEREKYSKEALKYFKTFHDPDSFKSEWISLIEGI